MTKFLPSETSQPVHCLRKRHFYPYFPDRNIIRQHSDSCPPEAPRPSCGGLPTPVTPGREEAPWSVVLCGGRSALGPKGQGGLWEGAPSPLPRSVRPPSAQALPLFLKSLHIVSLTRPQPVRPSSQDSEGSLQHTSEQDHSTLRMNVSSPYAQNQSGQQVSLGACITGSRPTLRPRLAPRPLSPASFPLTDQSRRPGTGLCCSGGLC